MQVCQKYKNKPKLNSVQDFRFWRKCLHTLNTSIAFKNGFDKVISGYLLKT